MTAGCGCGAVGRVQLAQALLQPQVSWAGAGGCGEGSALVTQKDPGWKQVLEAGYSVGTGSWGGGGSTEGTLPIGALTLKP